jgi:hypothetical protein
LAIKKGAALYVAVTVAACFSTGSAVAFGVTSAVSACGPAMFIEAQGVKRGDNPDPAMRQEAQRLCPMGFDVGKRSTAKRGYFADSTDSKPIFVPGEIIRWPIKCHKPAGEPPASPKTC